MLGYLVFLVAMFIWWASRNSPLTAVRRAFTWVGWAVIVQMLLGITTVLYAAPWDIAIVHQLGAILVMVLVLRARFAALYPASQSLRQA